MKPPFIPVQNDLQAVTELTRLPAAALVTYLVSLRRRTCRAELEDVSFSTLSVTRGTMGLILLIIVVLLVLGALPTWPYSTGWGYYPSGGLGLILLILIVLLLMGRL